MRLEEGFEFGSLLGFISLHIILLIFAVSLFVLFEYFFNLSPFRSCFDILCAFTFTFTFTALFVFVYEHRCVNGLGCSPYAGTGKKNARNLNVVGKTKPSTTDSPTSSNGKNT